MKRCIEVTLRGPWKDKSASYHLAKWGCPPLIDYDSLPSLVHHYHGGHGIFHLPPAPTILSYLRKATRHPDACTALDLLARLSLFSHLDLDIAVAFIRQLIAADPHTKHLPRVHDWREVGVLAVDVLQSRWPGGPGLTDPAATCHQLRALRDDLAILETEAARQQWEKALARAPQGRDRLEPVT